MTEASGVTIQEIMDPSALGVRMTNAGNNGPYPDTRPRVSLLQTLGFAHAAAGAGTGAVTAMAAFTMRCLLLIWGSILAGLRIFDMSVLCVGFLRRSIMLRLAVTMFLMARRFIYTNLSIFSICV